jgi:membrane-associated protease RseP (regulator of RpoE activity)
MRRRLLGLIVAGLAAAPLAAVAGPSAAPVHHEFHWSFSSEKGRLGVAVIGMTSDLRTHFGAPADRGVLIEHVEPGSAAAAAGLEVGDVITTVQGQPARDASDVIAAMSSAKKGDRVTLDVIRNRGPLTLTATMTEDPLPASMLMMPQMGQMPDTNGMPPDMSKWFHDMMGEMPFPHDWGWGGWPGADTHRT